MALIILMGTFDRDSVDTQRIAAALADAMCVSDEEAMMHLEEIYKNPPPAREPDSKEMDIIFFDEHIGGPRQMSMSFYAPDNLKDVTRAVVFPKRTPMRKPPENQHLHLSGPRVVGKRHVAMMMSAAMSMSPEFMEAELDRVADAVKPKPTLDAKDVIMQLGSYKPEREFPRPDRIPVPKKYSRNKHRR